ncbi:MAG TPA: hypothetical protein PKI75_02845 [Candidatus Woesebacteria bacterium]|nr:hypothetical protein [Candidatus Woesebacteria bacterium]
MENGPEISLPIPDSADRDWGKTGYQEMLAYTGRFPDSHRGNILHVFESLRPGVKPEDWLNRKVDLSDRELEQLGKKLKGEPVLSKVSFGIESFIELARTETQRSSLAELLSETDLGIKTLELRLFTDGQEVTIGWKEELPGEEKQGWVLGTGNFNSEEGEKIIGNLEKFRGLIPETKFVFKNGKALVLTEYVQGEAADENSVVIFRQKLAEKGLAEKDFDLNKQNLIRRPDKSIVYVDRDYLDLGRK